MNDNQQQKSAEILNEGLQLAEGKWSKYMNGLVEGYKRKHQGMAPESNIIATTAMMLENTQQMINRMDETTKVVNLGNFVDYGFGVITAIMPALVANEVVSVQPLKGRSGEVFFLDFKRGSNKGALAKGSTMISATRGASDDTTYSGEDVPNEALGTIAVNANAVTKEYNLSYLPVVPGTVEIALGNATLKDNGSGKFTLEGTLSDLTLADCAVNYETGAVTLVFSKITNEIAASASYRFSYGNMDVNGTIPTVDIDLTSTTISTVTRTLAARWLFDAAYELQQVHGINADEEIATALASEIRHEIDGEILNDLYASAKAGDQTFSWSKTPAQGVPMVDHKDTLVDKIIEMSNAIFADTQRAEGNFIVAGVNVSSVIESMGARFVPSTDGIKAGPHVIGTLDGRWKVIKNPFYSPNNFVVGYKGSSYLEGGYVYAPFLPLFTTPTVMLEDFVNRRGCRTIYGKKILNPRFYAKGIMTN